MERGCGLALESDSSTRFFANHNQRSNTSWSNSAIRMFGGIDFPVNLNRREQKNEDEAVDERMHDFFSSRPDSVADDSDDDGSLVKRENSDVNTGLHLLTTNARSDQSTADDGVSSDPEDRKAKNELAVLQTELQRMNSENRSLKEKLAQVTSSYAGLQMHLFSLMQQKQKAETIQESQEAGQVKSEEKQTLPRHFLDLGHPAVEKEEPTQTTSSDERTLDHSGSPRTNKNEIVAFEGEKNGKGAGREDSPASENQGWLPNKAPRLNNNEKPVDHVTEATMRKARVSVRARSEAPMISDGCQWRKYGQKMAKGNPCPRAYYRCTMAVGCPVRKQVQRCAEDRTILITTYEGNHNHPLPPAAMAMASTTSAAASMLLSGSMSSAEGIMNPNFLARTILPCSSSMATISASAPFPTVTLDLTHSQNPLQFQRHPSQFQVSFPGQLPQNFGAVASQQLPQIIGQALMNQSKFSGLHSSQDQASQPAAQPQLHQNQNAAIADMSAVIASNPNFTAAIAAAISSLMGGGAPNSGASATNAAAASSGGHGNGSCSNSSMQQK